MNWNRKNGSGRKREFFGFDNVSLGQILHKTWLLFFEVFSRTKGNVTRDDSQR